MALTLVRVGVYFIFDRNENKCVSDRGTIHSIVLLLNNMKIIKLMGEKNWTKSAMESLYVYPLQPCFYQCYILYGILPEYDLQGQCPCARKPYIFSGVFPQRRQETPQNIR